MRGGRRVTGHVERVRAGGAGRRIVQEAQEIHAAAIVMPRPASAGPDRPCSGVPSRPCWKNGPCRVILDSSLGMKKASKSPDGQPRINAVDRAMHASSRGLNALLCLIGVAMVVSTLARGGGPLALGVVLGVAFAVWGRRG